MVPLEQLKEAIANRNLAPDSLEDMSRGEVNAFVMRLPERDRLAIMTEIEALRAIPELSPSTTMLELLQKGLAISIGSLQLLGDLEDNYINIIAYPEDVNLMHSIGLYPLDEEGLKQTLADRDVREIWAEFYRTQNNEN